DAHADSKHLAGEERAHVLHVNVGDHRRAEVPPVGIEVAHEPRPRLGQVRDVDVVRHVRLGIQVAHEDGELEPAKGQFPRFQKRTALSQMILRRSSSGTFTKSSSITLREYGQSFPWCGKSVDQLMLSTPT